MFKHYRPHCPPASAKRSQGRDLKPLVTLFCLSSPVLAQVFEPEQVISTAASSPQSVYAIDLDDDGDVDVLSASQTDDKIACYDNLGNGLFGAQRLLTGPLGTISSADGARSVYAADLDGDGDPDVLSASQFDNKIAWYENLGNGSLGVQRIITQQAFNAMSVHAADLDGDGDNDVLSASASAGGKVAWYENLGGRNFGGEQLLNGSSGSQTSAQQACCVYASDLDGDGDIDVLSASRGDQKIAWYENLGGGQFEDQQVLGNMTQPHCVFAVDLDGDGDIDILATAAAGLNEPVVAWHENLGGGQFCSGSVIAVGDAQGVLGNPSVHATDLDGDADADILVSSLSNGKVAWYENLGYGRFSTLNVITSSINSPRSIYAADLDNDGDADVLSASGTDNKISWFENTRPEATFTTFGSGCPGPMGTPSLQQAVPDSRPVLGETLMLRLQQLPSPVFVGFLGLSNEIGFGVPGLPLLPFDLSSLGMPGCELLVSTELASIVLFGSFWLLPIPNERSLSGLPLNIQAVVQDPNANSLGFTVTNAATATVGF